MAQTIGFTPAGLERFERIIRDAKAPADLVEPCRLLCQSLGFRWYVFGLRMPRAIGDDLQFVISGLPAAWDRLYDERRYIEYDPLILRAIASIAPFGWDEIDFTRLSPRTKAFRAESLNHGFKHGLTVPLHGPALSVGIFNLMRDSTPLSTDPEVRTRLFAEAQIRVGQLFVKLHGLAADRARSEAPRLTPREHDVLKLSAIGHNAKLVAAKLGIKPRTVAAFVQSLCEKFHVETLREAVLKAVATGAIQIETYPDAIGRSDTWVHDDAVDKNP